MSYKQSQRDHTLFIEHSEIGALLVYVDDIIVRGNYEEEKKILKQCLPKKFEIKELKKLK